MGARQSHGASHRVRWLLRELVYALLVKKDHAAAGKIVVLMGAVGTVRPEAEAAKDLEKFAAPLTLKSLGDLSYAEIGKQLSALAEAYDVKLPRELVLIGKQSIDFLGMSVTMLPHLRSLPLRRVG